MAGGRLSPPFLSRGGAPRGRKLPFASPPPPPPPSLPNAINTAHSPLLQHRPFLHSQDQEEVLSLIPLLNQDVVELPGLEQRGNGPLDVAVIDGLMNDDARAADDLGRSEALVPLDYDTVNRRWAWLLSREDRLPSTKE